MDDEEKNKFDKVTDPPRVRTSISQNQREVINSWEEEGSIYQKIAVVKAKRDAGMCP